MYIRSIASWTIMAIASAVTLCSCSKQNGDWPNEKQALAIARAITSEVKGSHSGLVTSFETNQAATLHVDTSASMNGFALGDAKQPDPLFLKLNEYLSTRKSDRLQALSTKYSGSSAWISYAQLRFQTNYDGALDMALAIRGFSTSLERIHFFVTDGQPWDSGQNPGYQEVANAVTDFMTKGGRCSLFLYRSPYRGYYSSPISGSTVFYQCTNRPFELWVFSPAGCAYEQLVKDLTSRNDELKPLVTMQFGEPSFRVILTNTALPEPGKTTGQLIGRIHEAHTGYELGKPCNYPLLRIRRGAIDEHGYLPLQFDVEALSKMVGTTAEWFQQNVRIEMDCWDIPRNFPADKPVKEDKIATNRTAGLVHLWTKHLDSEIKSSTNTPGRFRLIVRVPPGSDRQAWVMTIRLKHVGPATWLPKDFSTPDDRKPDQSDRILKLDEMLGVLMANTEKLATVLFLTEP
jgi:hypothetical protein